MDCFLFFPCVCDMPMSIHALIVHTSRLGLGRAVQKCGTPGSDIYHKSPQLGWIGPPKLGPGRVWAPMWGLENWAEAQLLPAGIVQGCPGFGWAPGLTNVSVSVKMGLDVGPDPTLPYILLMFWIVIWSKHISKYFWMHDRVWHVLHFTPAYPW